MAVEAAEVLDTEPKAVLVGLEAAVQVLQINLHPLHKRLLALQILAAAGVVQTIRRHLLVRLVALVS